MFTESIVLRSRKEADGPAGLRETVCLPFLTASQNPNGGWGYHPGSESSVEATAWVLMALAARPCDAASVSSRGATTAQSKNGPGASHALNNLPQGEATNPALETSGLAGAICRGITWLNQTQLRDGSWPAFQGSRENCWATSLACLALSASHEAADRIASGLRWLVELRPGESTLWRRLQRRLVPGASVTRQNLSLYGWSWTPGTASWVEPTSYALILLANVPESLHPQGTAQRILLAESMLYDRMCAGGGWNAGNPEVYSVAGIPRVGPTAWALIALRRHGARPEHGNSVRWLENQYASIRGPGSLALAHLCLASCGRRVPPIEPALREWYDENQFFRSVLVFAWVTLALGGKLPWTIRAETPAPGSDR